MFLKEEAEKSFNDDEKARKKKEEEEKDARKKKEEEEKDARKKKEEEEKKKRAEALEKVRAEKAKADREREDLKSLRGIVAELALSTTKLGEKLNEKEKKNQQKAKLIRELNVLENGIITLKSDVCRLEKIKSMTLNRLPLTAITGAYCNK